MAVIIVLALLAITLTLSYAMLRSQVTSVRLQQNLTRDAEARQAALAGVNEAIHKMHSANWLGVDVPLSQQLSANQSFDVTYTTGDASLTSIDPNYQEYPYRVTITSTGYCKDPANPNVRAIHKVQAVVQLVRRALASEPSTWPQALAYTAYVWDDQTATIQIPVRVEGPLFLQDKFEFCPDDPKGDTPIQRNLSDFEAMRIAGLGDFRPLSGPVYLPYNKTSSTTRNLLTNNLKVTTVNVARSKIEPASQPGNVSTYRLYAGGKQYSVPRLQSVYGSSLTNVSLGPDVQTNPLGVFRSDGNLDLQSNVQINGTLITYNSNSSVQIRGTNVRFTGIDLRPLVGSSAKTQLPTAIVREDLRVRENCGGSITGLAAVWGKFEFVKGNPDVTFDVRGKLLAASLKLSGRDNWNLSSSTWQTLYLQFLVQAVLPLLPGASAYFPEYVVNQQGLRYQPLLTIRPESVAVTYHWQDWTKPIYVPHANDGGGLRWDLVSWRELQ